jgi:hypothetical protein
MRRLPLLLTLALSCKPDIDFTQGHPYACAYGDDTKCGQGWRCGREMQCHQIGTPGTYLCSRDAGDCEASWACGVDGVCINPDDAGMNACVVDTDCFHGLRCNVEGRCTPLNGDSISPTDSPPGALTVLGPLVAPDGVTNSGVAWSIQPRTGDPQADALRAWTGAAVSRNNVTTFTNIGNHGDVPLVLVDAGTFSQVQQIATAPNGVYIRTDGGIVVSFTNGNGTELPVHFTGNVPFGIDWDLRSFQGTGIGQLPDGGNEHYSCAVLSTDGGPDFHLINGQIVRGLRQSPESVRSELFGFGPCLIAAAPDGLFSGAIAGDGGWGPLSLPELTTNGNTCGGNWSGPPLRARGAEPNLLAVALDTNPLTPDGGPTLSKVALFDLGELLKPVSGGPDACAATVDASCHEARVKMVLGVCGACAQLNESLYDFFPLVLGQSYGVQTDCVINGTLHTYEVTQDLDGTCHQTRFMSTEPQFKQLLDPPVGGTNPFALAKAGQHGELWAGENLIGARPLFLDRAPGGVFRPEAQDGGTVPLHMFADEWIAEALPVGLAVQDLKGATPIAAAVTGDAADVVLTDRRVGRYRDPPLLLTVFATVNATDQTFLPPYAARAVSRTDGKLEFVVRSFDTVYSGHAPDVFVGAWTIKQQVVPSAGIPITSLVTQTADAGTDLLQGYALTNAGLFRLTQDQNDAWTSTPVTTAPGNRVAVFMEAGASRLGYDDGTVYALPSRVPLTTPVPNAHFQSFLHACGETWAIADQGLMRLAPDDGGTGHWVNEPLDSADPKNFSAAALSGGRLFQAANTLYVFNAYGGALTFVPQAGCNGADAGM